MFKIKFDVSNAVIFDFAVTYKFVWKDSKHFLNNELELSYTSDSGHILTVDHKVDLVDQQIGSHV